MQAQALQPPKMLDRRGSSFGTSNLTFGESSYFFQLSSSWNLWAFISIMYPPPVHAAAPFKSHRVCVFWTCCVSLSVMTRRFFLSFNLRSRRVHLVQPNLQQAPRARFHCGVTGRCVVSLPPRELPVVLRKARTISKNKKFFSQPTHSRLRSQPPKTNPSFLNPPFDDLLPLGQPCPSR